MSPAIIRSPATPGVSDSDRALAPRTMVRVPDTAPPTYVSKLQQLEHSSVLTPKQADLLRTYVVVDEEAWADPRLRSVHEHARAYLMLQFNPCDQGLRFSGGVDGPASYIQKCGPG